MKNNYLKWMVLALAALQTQNTMAQFGLKSASESSGILVGTQDKSRFSGINYNTSSEALEFGHSLARQQVLGPGATGFPEFWMHQFQLGFVMDKGVQKLIDAGTWKGQINASYTLSYTWDWTPIGTFISAPKKRIYYCPSDPKPKRTEYQEQATCECCCDTACDFRTKQLEDSLKGHQNDNRMLSLFIRPSYESRMMDVATTGVNTFETEELLSHTPKLYLGINHIRGINAHWQATYSFGAGLKYQSFNKTLSEERTVDRIGQTVIDGSNTLNIIDKSKTYYVGNPKSSWDLYPRVDILFQRDLGADNPFLGIMGSFQPNFVFTSGPLKGQLNASIGPVVSPPKLSDQVVFALLADFSNFGDANEYEFGLILHAGVPFNVKKF